MNPDYEEVEPVVEAMIDYIVETVKLPKLYRWEQWGNMIYPAHYNNTNRKLTIRVFDSGISFVKYSDPWNAIRIPSSDPELFNKIGQMVEEEVK
jgi:hypothetical protein